MSFTFTHEWAFICIYKMHHFIRLSHISWARVYGFRLFWIGSNTNYKKCLCLGLCIIQKKMAAIFINLRKFVTNMQLPMWYKTAVKLDSTAPLDKKSVYTYHVGVKALSMVVGSSGTSFDYVPFYFRGICRCGVATSCGNFASFL